MEKAISVAERDTKFYWVIWFPAFRQTKNFEVIKNPVKGDLNDPMIREGAKGKNWLKRRWLKFKGKYYSEKERIKIEFVDSQNNLVTPGTSIDQCYINLYYKTKDQNNNEIEVEINLKYLESSSNGLFLYECSSKSFAAHCIEDIRVHATAHHLKKGCHEHIFHGYDSDEDSYGDYYFKPYAPPDGERPEIKEEYNNAITWYLNKISDRSDILVSFFEQEIIRLKNEQKSSFIERIKYWFKNLLQSSEPRRLLIQNLQERAEELENEKDEVVAFLLGFIDENAVKKNEGTVIPVIVDEYELDHDLLKDKYNELDNEFKIEAKKRQQDFVKLLRKGVEKAKIYENKKKSRDSRSKDCLNAIGETLYFNSLLSSKYLKTDGPVNDDVRRNLLNQENSTKAFHLFADYFQSKEGEKRHKISIGWAVVSVVLSVIFFVFGLFAAPYVSNIISFRQNAGSFENIQKSINEHTEQSNQNETIEIPSI